MLVRCLYASRAIEPLPANVLDQIVEKSRKNNIPRGITGLLCFSNGIFVQALEGGRAPVSALIGTIFSDNRHKAVQLLLFQEIEHRHFGNWTMGKVNINSVNSGVLMKYSERAELDPFACPGATTMALLMELAASGSIISRGS